MERLMVNSNKYNGKYVAMASIEDNTIIGHGDTPEEALNNAREKGIQNPFLLYVPDEDIVHIYYVDCSWLFITFRNIQEARSNERNRSEKTIAGNCGFVDESVAGSNFGKSGGIQHDDRGMGKHRVHVVQTVRADRGQTSKVHVPVSGEIRCLHFMRIPGRVSQGSGDSGNAFGAGWRQIEKDKTDDTGIDKGVRAVL